MSEMNGLDNPWQGQAGSQIAESKRKEADLSALVTAAEQVIEHLEDFASQFDGDNNEPLTALNRLDDALEPFRIRASTHGLMGNGNG